MTTNGPSWPELGFHGGHWAWHPLPGLQLCRPLPSIYSVNQSLKINDPMTTIIERKSKRMPRKQKTTIYVYAILSEIDTRCYVGQCRPESIRPTYRQHISGKYQATRNLFSESITAQKMPSLYIVSEYTASSLSSKTQVYAFLKYFQDQGYDVLVSGEAEEWLKDISDASQAIYDSLAKTSIRDILTDDACVIHDYQLREWAQAAAAASTTGTVLDKNAPATLSMYTTVGTKNLLQERAAQCGMSLSNYVEQMALNGVVVQADNQRIYAAVNDIYKALTTLDKSITKFGGFYAGHKKELDRIEKEVSRISMAVKQATESTVAGARNEAAKTVRKAIKLKRGRIQKGEVV